VGKLKAAKELVDLVKARKTLDLFGKQQKWVGEWVEGRKRNPKVDFNRYWDDIDHSESLMRGDIPYAFYRYADEYDDLGKHVKVKTLGTWQPRPVDYDSMTELGDNITMLRGKILDGLDAPPSHGYMLLNDQFMDVQNYLNRRSLLNSDMSPYWNMMKKDPDRYIKSTGAHEGAHAVLPHGRKATPQMAKYMEDMEYSTRKRRFGEGEGKGHARWRAQHQTYLVPEDKELKYLLQPGETWARLMQIRRDLDISPLDLSEVKLSKSFMKMSKPYSDLNVTYGEPEIRKMLRVLPALAIMENPNRKNK
jgi:hypothetical protein